ncbi:aminoglycoside phosphotransferase family protein [Christensenellaceae bacterium OttesenSCG-928-L17]|nr:aminoglycoside phosphotransferase family protein [Christensenellaceae bacterium OttesenSCG-928-L17]
MENERNILKRLTGAEDYQIQVNETGWTSRVYIIDGGKAVFKFPRNAKFREECKREVAVLRLLNERTFGLRVPVLNWTSPDNAYFGFWGVEGKPLKEVIGGLGVQQKVDIGTQLGHFLQQLHGIKDYGDMKAQTLKEQAKEYHEWFMKGRDLLKDYFQEFELHAIDCFFEHDVPKSMTGTGELVFCHGDLDYNNVLINSNNQAGVIDFGDAMLYDRSQDFRGMEDAVLLEAMIKAYGGGEVISREAAAASAKMIDVLNMIYYIEQNDKAAVHDFAARIRSMMLPLE